MNPMMSAAKKRRRTTIDPVTPRHRSLAEGAAAAVAAASGEAGPADISAVGYRDAPPPEVLFNKSWRLFSSSPMFKFDSDAKTLKSYAKQFSAFLLAKRNHGGGVAVSGVSGAKLAKFSVLPGVSWTDDDPDAILVEIDGAKPADSLQAILCSVNNSELGRPAAGFVHFPLVLVKASSSTTQTFVNWLEKRFDCRLSNLELSPVDLKWIATEWGAPSESAPAKIQRSLELTYRTPDGVNGINTITYATEAGTIREIRDSILEVYDTTVVEELQLIEAMEAHFFETFKIKLSTMTLARVGTYVAYVGQEGRLKLLNVPPDHKKDALIMLSFLTYVAVKEAVSHLAAT
eukprot:m.157225 g.157225  ORF g.157225 m.157225 type:complete len:346 (+) comp23653_c0_seq3:3-1040(+)